MARRWLARRDYSRAELCERLQREGLDRPDAEALTAELADGWWQSDERFAVTLVRTRARQGKGPRLVRVELSQHGIEGNALREAFDEAEVNWLEAATEALRRTSKVDVHAQRQHLMRKGFEGDQIRELLGRG